VRIVGQGAMSVVYEALDTRLGRRVAVKVLNVPLPLPPGDREEMVARLDREARVIGALSHPNVVTIFDVGEQNGIHYLVMEFLDGETLHHRLDRDGPLSVAEAGGILEQIADGLDVVHAAGVVHRDIKPSNVMLLPADGAGFPRVKLLDFGVAR